MTLPDIILAKLTADHVINGTSGYRGYAAYLPDDQDQVVIATDGPSRPQSTIDGQLNEEGVQVRVRSTERDYLGCETKWRQIFNSLQDADLSANGVYFIQANHSGPIIFYDAKLRVNMTLNMQVKRQRP